MNNTYFRVKATTCHWDKKFWGCILDELYWKKQIFFQAKNQGIIKNFVFLFVFPYILGSYMGLSILQPDPAAEIIWFWFNWNVCLQLLRVYACRVLTSAYVFGCKVHIHTIIIVFIVATMTTIIFTTPQLPPSSQDIYTSFIIKLS